MGKPEELYVPIPRRTVLKGAAILGGSALLAACGNGGPPAATKPRGITVKDQRGKTLVFDGPVKRVVTVPMPAASILVAVDRTADHLVGMQTASWTAMRDGIMGRMFPGTLEIPHDVASQEFAPNVESILALKPDVVVQWADQGAGIIAPMENAGLTVLGVQYGTQETVNTWLRMFAAMLGKPDHAKEMISRIDNERKRIESAASGRSAKPKILYFNRFAEGLKVAGNRTYNDDYIRLVGATNPAAGDGGAPGMGMVGVDVEQVLKWDPDVILLGNFDAAMPDDIYKDTVWEAVSAVKSRRVYKAPLGGYRWDPPSQESPLMWKWLSRIAFPSDQNAGLRDDIVSSYALLYDYKPSDAEMDDILWTGVNKASANYGQFDAA
ncbi:MAG: ABC transporter substrate-binding protein [Actinomycetota bacterium]|nr:ABC transporter substrate-binding protein [Actinomycetota bacterium]